MRYPLALLEQALYEHHLVTPLMWTQAAAAATKNGSSIVNYLLHAHLVPDRALCKLAQEIFELPTLSPEQLLQKFQKNTLLPHSLQKKFYCLVLNHQEVALSDPTHTECLEKLQGYLGHDFQLYCLPFESLRPFLENSPRDFSPASASEDTLVNVFYLAQERHASDIHLEPHAGKYRVRLRSFGILHEVFELSLAQGRQWISKCKVLAKLDIAEQRLPQDGHMSMTLGDHLMHCRLNTCPTTQGEKLVIRLLDQYHHLSISELGFTELQEKLFDTAIRKPQGLILVTGPTGSGKTTTLYSALQTINSTEQNLSSIEDPVEIELPGVNQINIHPEIGLDFPEILRALLRQDPDIVMVGEIRDELTAKITIRAAQTGHLVLATLHTNHALAAITRLLQMKVQAYELQSALLLVTAQRLLRRLCPLCKTPLTSGDACSYQPVGCSHCHKGYTGRMAIHELLPMNPELEHHLSCLQNQTFTAPPKILTLQERGKQLVEAGITSLAEYLRVLG